jgi:hypothetical protein
VAVRPEPGGTDEQVLSVLLSGPAWVALDRWMRQTGVTLQYAEWSGAGNTDARLYAVFGHRPGDRLRKLIIKVISPDDDPVREPGLHASAQTYSPEEFCRLHLVRQPWDPVAFGDGGWIMFQGLAGGSLNNRRSLAAVLDESLRDGAALDRVAETCGEVVACALGEWNRSTGPIHRLAVPEFLGRILGLRLAPGGRLEQWARANPELTGWRGDGCPDEIALPGESGHWLNPLALARNPGLSHRTSVPALVGHAHGDLHPGNVILAADGPTHRDEQDRGPWFIDLSCYDRAAVLARDPVHFILSVVARFLPDLTDTQRRALADVVVDPRAPAQLLPAGLHAAVDAVHRAGLDWAQQNEVWDEWEQQHLLAVVGCGLLYAARRPTRDGDRAWYFHLAARAAERWRASRPEIRTAAAAPAAPAVPLGPVWRLPQRSSSAVFRNGPAVALAQLCRKDTPDPVVVHGPSGSGKTQLLVAHINRVAERYRHIAWLSGSGDDVEALKGQLAELISAAFPGTRPGGADPVALFDLLRPLGPWLFVVDDVADPAALAGWLPPRGDGVDLLIAAAKPGPAGWPSLALGPFDRQEAVQVLVQRSDRLVNDDAARVAAVLEDFPLAVGQAAAFLHDTLFDADDYLELLRTAALPEPGVDDSPTPSPSLVRSISIALENLRRTEPAAEDLLLLRASFGTDPVPVAVLEAGREHLPPGLAHAAAEPAGLSPVIEAARRSGLIETSDGAVRMHRFFRDELTARLDPATAREYAGRARHALAAADPGDPRDPRNWPLYRQLFSHALTLRAESDPEPSSQRLVHHLTYYLIERGSVPLARSFALFTRLRCREAFGERAEPTLRATSRLAHAEFRAGRHRDALAYDLKVYQARCGDGAPDGPAALAAGRDLALDLTMVGLAAQGATRAETLEHAAVLHAQVATRSRAVLGPDDPGTLRSLHNFAVHLRATGQPDAARVLEDLAHDGLTRRLGADHPDALAAAHALALDLRAADERAAAADLEEHVYRGLRTGFGGAHPDALRSGRALAGDLRALGRADEARAVETALSADLNRWRRLGREAG